MLDSNHKGLSSLYVSLRFTYGLVPIVSGLDKFSDLLTDWQRYLPDVTADVLPISPAAFLHLVSG